MTISEAEGVYSHRRKPWKLNATPHAWGISVQITPKIIFCLRPSTGKMEAKRGSCCYEVSNLRSWSTAFSCGQLIPSMCLFCLYDILGTLHQRFGFTMYLLTQALDLGVILDPSQLSNHPQSLKRKRIKEQLLIPADFTFFHILYFLCLHQIM